MIKEDIINRVIETEGGYVYDPLDSGGETNYGITKSVAREYGFDGEMIDLPRDVAFDIYNTKYWDSVRGDELLEMSEAVAHEVVDTCVNMGAIRASNFLQRALNVLNNRGGLYPDIIVDGFIGDETLRALRKYLSTREEAVLVKALNCLQGAFYIDLAERRASDEAFIYGWLKQRVIL